MAEQHPKGYIQHVEEDASPWSAVEQKFGVRDYATVYFGFNIAPPEWPQLKLIDDLGTQRNLRGNPIVFGTDGLAEYELAVEIFKARGYDKDKIREAIIAKLDEYLDNLGYLD